MLEEINDLISKKEFDKAKKLLEPALKEEPENVELLKLAGLVASNEDDWIKARSCFETVVKFKPEDATSWFYLASAYDRLGDFVSAKNAYIKVIDLRSEYSEAYKSLCVVLMKMNEAEEAIKYAIMANAVEPDDYIFDFVIGTAYMKIKEFEKSIEPFKRALEKEPDNIGIYNSLGTAYMATGSSNEAIKCYKKALELNTENPMAYYNLGSAYQIQQNHEEACIYLEKACELDDEDEGFKVALAMSKTKLERYQEAANIYKNLLLQHPEKENYKYNLATCLEMMGDLQGAIKMLEGIVYVNQKFILPVQKLASLYIRTNQLNKAKELYDNILLKGQVSAETFHQYAILSSSLCDTETAEKMLKKEGFKVDSKKKASDDVDENLVIETDPAKNRYAKKGTTVTIYYSSGTSKTKVEDYTGQNAYEVKAKLELLGIKVTIEEKEVENSSSYTNKKQLVIDQSVKQGEKLSKGEKIVLYIPKILSTYPDMVTDSWTLDRATEFCEKYG